MYRSTNRNINRNIKICALTCNWCTNINWNIYIRAPTRARDPQLRVKDFAMNREQLIAAATKNINQGDVTQHDPIPHYLGAIAKLLLAAEMPRDAAASPRITDASEWLPGDPQ